jgi:hypothetical protein
MITRRNLTILGLATVAMFILSVVTRNLHHGLGGAFGFFCWWAFVLCALVLLVACVATLIHHRTGSRQN